MPVEVRFDYGLSSGSLNRTAYYNNGGLTAGSGSYSVTLSSLEPGTTYYYRAVIQVGNKDFYGSVKSFTTSSSSTQQDTSAGWLELPAGTSKTGQVNGHFGSGSSRNYSYLYDKTVYAPLWTAYPLTSSHTSGSANGSWAFNPNIEKSAQIDVKSSSYSSNYNAATYSRGHIVPRADRTGSSAMCKEVFYLTNQVPQIQTQFNDGVWNSLENAVRGLTNQADTVYVTTGVCFQTAGGNETVEYIYAAKDDIYPKKVPIANYFYKVILKVRRDSTGKVTAASAIGFWFEHRKYTDSYTNYAVSVDRIESMTGIDFFANLPDSVEATAESNTSWSNFQSFK